MLSQEEKFSPKVDLRHPLVLLKVQGNLKHRLAPLLVQGNLKHLLVMPLTEGKFEYQEVLLLLQGSLKHLKHHLLLPGTFKCLLILQLRGNKNTRVFYHIFYPIAQNMKILLGKFWNMIDDIFCLDSQSFQNVVHSFSRLAEKKNIRLSYDHSKLVSNCKLSLINPIMNVLSR